MRFFVALALLVACGRAPDADAWFTRTAQASQAADAALQRGDLAAAVSTLRAAARDPAPWGVDVRDRRIVAQDLQYRLSRLQLQLGHAEEARSAADQGLLLGGGDLFTANLLVARAAALESLGRDAEAAADYHQALRIDEDLLRATLETR